MNKIIFLGTGAASSLTRQLTSILFVTDRKNFLIDCGDGMGTVRNLVKSGVALESVTDVFITHRHADHMLGMPHFLLTQMIGNDKTKVRVFGPKQALDVVRLVSFKTHDYLKKHASRIAFVSMKPNVSVRLAPGLTVTGTKVAGPKGGAIITYAYKITVDGKTVVFSSDMHPNALFDKLAKNTDVMIHECFGPEKDREQSGLFGHSTAREAGEAAMRAKVKKLILTHIRDEKVVSVKSMVTEARRYFNGFVIPAEDLLAVEF